MAELVEALNKLHFVRLSDSWAKEILSKMHGADDEFLETLEQPLVFGSPHTGFLKDGPTLLHYIMKRRKLNHLFYTTNINSEEIKIQSSFEELGSTIVTDNDMENWPEEAVFCHNDLTARNFILRSEATTEGELVYKLAGIIDWELAGFYPASYELSLQDTYLGADLHLSFYLLFKEQMNKAVPRSLSQITLLQAMELIYESQQRLLKERNNIPANIRKRLLDNSKIVRDDDPYAGWTRSAEDGLVLDPSNADFQQLVDDVIKEMVAKRKA